MLRKLCKLAALAALLVGGLGLTPAPAQGPAPPLELDVMGTWEETCEYWGKCRWVLSGGGGGRFVARQHGHGNASGTFSVTGTRAGRSGDPHRLDHGRLRRPPPAPGEPHG